MFFFFFFNDTATTEIYTLSLHDALPISFAARAMSRVVTQPSPCEHSSRSVAPMSFSLWSIAGERELRAAAGLAMRDRAGVLFELSERSRIMSECSTRCQAPQPFRAAVYFGGSGAWLYGCLGSLSGGR